MEPAARFTCLISDTYRLLHRQRRPEYVALTPEGRALLLHLAWAGPMTIGELALHADRAQSVISESVAVLESHEMLARVRDPRDARRTLVWLTERARAWLEEEQQPLDRERVATALAAMPPDTRDTLLATFDEFVATANAQRPSSIRAAATNVVVMRKPNKKKERKS